MSAKKVVVVGAGIAGVSAGIWLLRAGHSVTLIDKGDPGQGASFGNAGILACCSMLPVTGPGLISKGPGYLLDKNFPLFVRWSYMPKLAPWLARYMSHANDADTRRIAAGIAGVVTDSVDQHQDLSGNTIAAKYVKHSNYSYAYADRKAFEADKYLWDIRRHHGFDPEIIEGAAVQEVEPFLGDSIGLLAQMTQHGFVLDPGSYVATLAQVFVDMGGTLAKEEVVDFDLSGGRVSSVQTTQSQYACDAAVVASGVWSKPLMKKLGLNVPLEAERGYHVIFKNPNGKPKQPLMMAAGKFVATPMNMGLRCAGIVEFGGTEAPASKEPLELLRKSVKTYFPELEAEEEEEWLGFRPATTDSLPVIGEVGSTGVYAAFGHHHIGLTAGPKTGRLVAEMIDGQPLSLDVEPYNPGRFN